MGWKLSKLAIIAYIINIRFFFDKANLPISGIQLIFLVILIGVPLSGKSGGKGY